MRLGEGSSYMMVAWNEEKNGDVDARLLDKQNYQEGRSRLFN